MENTNVIASGDSATLNFKSLFDQAMDFLPDNLEKPVANPSPVDGVPPPPAEAKPPAPPVAAPAPAPVEAAPVVADKATPREVGDDDLVKVKVDGEVKVISGKEYKDGIQREASYTKRMQALARQREEAESHFSNEYAKLYQMAQAVELAKQQLQAESPLAKLATQLEAQQKVERDPNTLATLGEIKAALQSQQAEFDKQLSQRDAQHQNQLATAVQSLQSMQAQARDAARFTSALEDTLASKDFAIVRSTVPSPELADAIIRFRVAQMAPESIEQGIEFMHNVVKEWADGVKTQFQADRGRADAEKARASIESPVGSPPAPAPVAPRPGSFFKKDGTGLDWDALRLRAEAQMTR